MIQTISRHEPRGPIRATEKMGELLQPISSEIEKTNDFNSLNVSYFLFTVPLTMQLPRQTKRWPYQHQSKPTYTVM